KDQQRFTKAGCFLLHTARVGNDQPAGLHNRQKGRVIHWLEQMNAVVSAEDLIGNLAYVGVRVYGEQYAHIIVLVDKSSDHLEVAAHRRAKTPAAVSGQQNTLFTRSFLDQLLDPLVFAW